MATLKFTREMARKTFDTLADRVPESHVIGLSEKRLAVRRRGNTVFFCFHELPTEDVIGWVGGINARTYYRENGKRLPIGSSVDDLYKRVNLWLQQQTKSSQPQPTARVAEPAIAPTPRVTKTLGSEISSDSAYARKVKELVNIHRDQGARGPRLAHRVRMELMNEFKGSWGQRGTIIVFRPSNGKETFEIDVAEI